jgi:hypothetical protein
MYSSSTNQGGYVEYTETPTRPQTRPSYNLYPTVQSNHARFNNNATDDDGSTLSLRGSNTLDLAAFLRDSSPKDFQQGPSKGGATPDEHFSFSSSAMKSLKFLRSPASKSKLRQAAQPQLPENVRAQKTARGKAYLSIHVDYDKNYQPQFQPHDGKDRFSLSDADTTASRAGSRPHTSDNRVSLSPAPWATSARSTKTVDTETAESYQKYIMAEHNLKVFANKTPPRVRSPSIDAVGGGRVAGGIQDKPLPEFPPAEVSSIASRVERAQRELEEVRQSRSTHASHPSSLSTTTTTSFPPVKTSKSSKRHSDPHGYTYAAITAQSDTSKSRRKSTSTAARRASRSSYSSRSSIYSTGDEFIDIDAWEARRRSRRPPPPRPGPPPARSLPALPETPGFPAPPSGGLLSPTLLSPPLQRATSPRLKKSRSRSRSRSRRRGNSVSSDDGAKTTDESGGRAGDRTSREMRVKARKLRDMQQVRARRQAASKLGASALSSDEAEEGAAELRIITTTEAPMSYGGKRHSSASQTLQQDRKHSSTGTNLGNLAALNTLQGHNKMRGGRRASATTLATLSPDSDSFPMPPRSARSCAKSFVSDCDSEMESRLEAVERKNRMLEKMLIAVIRGTVGQDQRQKQLQRAESVDDLLRQLTLVEKEPDLASARKGSVSTVGGGMVSAPGSTVP